MDVISSTAYGQASNCLPFDPLFWVKVDRSTPEECWIWTGSHLKNGYGNLGRKGKTYLAHRYSYMLLVGPIPEGKTLDHLCRNRLCVNPAHLEPVSRGENVMRGEGITARYAAQTHCVHGHLLDEENTYYRPDYPQWRYCRACHRERVRNGKKHGYN